MDRIGVINRPFYSVHVELIALWPRIFALEMPRQVWFEDHLHKGILQVCIYSYVARGACVGIADKTKCIRRGRVDSRALTDTDTRIYSLYAYTLSLLYSNRVIIRRSMR